MARSSEFCTVVQCLVVLHVELSTVSNCLVSNCLRSKFQFQIVHGVKLSGVKLFTISNCDCDILHTLRLKMLIMSESESVQVNHCISCISWLLSFNEESQIWYWIYLDTDIESEWQLKDYSCSLYLWLVKCLWFSFGPVNCLKLGNSTPILHCLFCFRRCPLGCP